MALYRDTKNEFPLTIIDDATGDALDISSYDSRLVLWQNGITISLTMGDGLSFDTDGTDGVLNISISKARINTFCAGWFRAQLFDDSGSDPLMYAEGSDTVEGQRYDA